MKKQLVVTIEEELIPAWKAEAKSLGTSLSNLIEMRMGNKPKALKRFSDFFDNTKDLMPEKSIEEIKDDYLMEKYG